MANGMWCTAWVIQTLCTGLVKNKAMATCHLKVMSAHRCVPKCKSAGIGIMKRKDRTNWKMWIAQNPSRVSHSRKQAQSLGQCTCCGGPFSVPLRVPGRVVAHLSIAGVGPSLNAYYAGLHWTQRQKVTDSWHDAVATYVMDHELDPILIRTRCVFILEHGPGQKLMDSINLAVTCKMMEDGLVSVGILQADTPSWVQSHQLVGIRGNRTVSHLIYVAV